MILFQYLDRLPKIPKELLEDPYIPDEDLIGVKYGGYVRWAPRPELKEWLRENISEQVRLAGVQTLDPPQVFPHCDGRAWGLNYLIDTGNNTGGNEVMTTFYQRNGEDLLAPPNYRRNEDPLNVVHRVQIQKYRWHIMNTNVIHGIYGMKSVRKAVTLGFTEDNPFELIKGYQGFFSPGFTEFGKK
jgi:hypothetical protein